MMKPRHDEQFQVLLNEHKGILYKVCYSYCRNSADREDLAQEIIVQLWRSFERFDGRARFSTWMYRIALNVAISYARRESTRVRYVISDEERVLQALDTSHSAPEEIGLLNHFIEKLDGLNKALMLLYLDGNSYEEMAGVLGITATNVATKISRLKNSIRHKYQGEGEA